MSEPSSPGLEIARSLGFSPQRLDRAQSDQTSELGSRNVENTSCRSASRGSGLEFRTEFYNALNHAQFANPDSNFSSPAFGVIRSTAVNARVGQLALKFGFQRIRASNALSASLASVELSPLPVSLCRRLGLGVDHHTDI
jgi:hypothetical protein